MISDITAPKDEGRKREIDARMSEIMVGWATAFLIFNLKDGPPFSS